MSTHTQPWLPFGSAAGADRIQADSGGASFLPEAVAALKELQADPGVACGGIQQPQDAVDNAYNSSAVFDIKVATPEAAPPVEIGMRCSVATSHGGNHMEASTPLLCNLHDSFL